MKRTKPGRQGLPGGMPEGAGELWEREAWLLRCSRGREALRMREAQRRMPDGWFATGMQR